MNKIEILKELIESEEDDLRYWKKCSMDLNSKYIGETLLVEEKKLQKYINESAVKLEAFNNELKNVELLAEQNSTFDTPN